MSCKEWKEYSIGELCDISSSKRIYSREYVEKGVPFYRSKEIIKKHNLEELSEVLYISEDRFKEIDDKFGSPRKGDMLLTSVGTLGVPYIVKKERFYFKDGNLTWFKNFSADLNSFFLYYWIQSNIGKNQINKITIGSTQQALTIESLKKMLINLPPIAQQKAIANILSTLDKKIETNNQINKNLEEMAQAIFKHWFVDFEFPCLPENYKFSGAGKPTDYDKVLTYKRVGGLPIPDGKSWFVYVLLCEGGSFYKGITKDLYRRFYEHYTGNGAKWTKAHKPIKVIHYEKYDTQQQARKREEQLKTGIGREWLKREYKKYKAGKPAHKMNAGKPAHQTCLMMAGEMVESDLPDRGMKSGFGMIPKGWEVKSLDEIANYINGLAMQKFRPEGAVSSYPVLKIKELRQGFADSNSDKCSQTIDKRYLINDGDIIFSWSGSLLIDIWSGGKCGLNQHLFKVTSDEYDKWFYYQWTKYHLDRFVRIAESKATTMGHIKRKDLSDSKVLIPTEEIYAKANLVFKPLIEKVTSTKIEAKRLKNIRDTLLPKLMSGEIRVAEYNGELRIKNGELQNN